MPFSRSEQGFLNCIMCQLEVLSVEWCQFKAPHNQDSRMSHSHLIPFGCHKYMAPNQTSSLTLSRASNQTPSSIHLVIVRLLLLLTVLLFSSPGITVDKFGLIYFVDGTMIRRIDQNGIISTVLGSNDLTSARPLSCDSVMDISQVRQCFG